MTIVDQARALAMKRRLRGAVTKGELRGAESERRELLSEAFAEQTGRAPTPDEQAALAKRAQEVGAKQALRALFKLHGDALVAWLLGNGTPPSASDK